MCTQGIFSSEPRYHHIEGYCGHLKDEFKDEWLGPISLFQILVGLCNQTIPISSFPGHSMGKLRAFLLLTLVLAMNVVVWKYRIQVHLSARCYDIGSTTERRIVHIHEIVLNRV